MLTLEDYPWEIRSGGDPAIDLTDIAWDDEAIGESVRFADLQSYLLVHLLALRDVENETLQTTLGVIRDKPRHQNQVCITSGSPLALDGTSCNRSSGTDDYKHKDVEPCV